VNSFDCELASLGNDCCWYDFRGGIEPRLKRTTEVGVDDNSFGHLAYSSSVAHGMSSMAEEVGIGTGLNVFSSCLRSH